MARDLLRPSQHLTLTPRLKLTPGTDTMDTDTVLDTMVDTTVDIMATPTTATMARGLLMQRLPLLLKLMPRLIPGMDTTLDFHTTATATLTMDMAMAMVTTGASKKGSNQELTRMKCQHFDDDLPNVLNFREESKCTKQNILLLQTHCILTFIHFRLWYICMYTCYDLK